MKPCGAPVNFSQLANPYGWSKNWRTAQSMFVTSNIVAFREHLSLSLNFYLDHTCLKARSRYIKTDTHFFRALLNFYRTIIIEGSGEYFIPSFVP
jgi:hypothetical protein